ncbi:hypothetical protein [Microtetraspora malaysiensis]|uniref:hypothetical protein n=1 Tax=Microtetraspora malaysiensis TaxID=161358 RepID=UPI003D8E07DA
MTDSTTDRAYAELAALRDRLPGLREALVSGTRRRWTQRDLTPEQRARLDRRAREERTGKEYALSHGLAVLGASPAPLDMDVMAAEMHIGEAVAVLEIDICEQFGLTPLKGATTAVVITRIVGLLDRIAADEDLAAYVLDEARRLNRRAAGALGDVEPPRRLDARCPICDAKSLRMLADRELVVCGNPGCRCGDESCPCRWERSRRPHMWERDAWPWLAKVVA